MVDDVEYKKEWSFNDYPIAKQIVKDRIYTSFCETCPIFCRQSHDCIYIRETAFRVLLRKITLEKEINEFTCPYNAERLIYGRTVN